MSVLFVNNPLSFFTQFLSQKKEYFYAIPQNLPPRRCSIHAVFERYARYDEYSYRSKIACSQTRQCKAQRYCRRSNISAKVAQILAVPHSG
jgi:hypothetical protein